MRAVRHALIRGLKLETQADFDTAMSKLVILDKASGGCIEFDLALDEHDHHVIIVSHETYEALSLSLDIIQVNYITLGYDQIRSLVPNVYHRHRRLFVSLVKPKLH